MKQYRTGMYGGKFLPLHKGHLWCIEQAAQLCDIVYVILFYGGTDEERICAYDTRAMLNIEQRIKQLKNATKQFSNVQPVCIDVSKCRTPNGEEDWDAETPLVLNTCGNLDAVFSSEPSYEPYFTRAYPNATHILLDPHRKTIPISATMIRNMTDTEAQLWMV